MSPEAKIFNCNQSLVLSNKISKSYGIALGKVAFSRYSDGEFQPSFEESVRGARLFIIGSTHQPSDNLMELLLMLDAAKRASARHITAVIPYFGWARQDRKDKPRVPIGSKMIAKLIEAAGATRIITMDLHAGQIQGFFNIPFDNIYASPILLKYIRNEIMSDHTICISPDSGGVERVRHYAKKLKCDLAMIDKRRTGKNVAKAMNIVGDVEGKDCVIIDDMIDTAGTLVEACKALKNGGAL